MVDSIMDYFYNSKVYVTSDYLKDDPTGIVLKVVYEPMEIECVAFDKEKHKEKMAQFAEVAQKARENPHVDFSDELGKIMAIETRLRRKFSYPPPNI